MGQRKLLVIVDMQEDFVTGALGTPEARQIVKPITEFIRNWEGDRIFTKDTHHGDYIDTQEGKNLPVAHCIKGTDGWRIIPEIRELITDNDVVLEKGTFGSRNLGTIIASSDYTDICLCGVCTGICVISNAVIAKAADPEARIHILGGLCACVTPQSHSTALEAMRLLQMDITGSRDAMGEG